MDEDLLNTFKFIAIGLPCVVIISLLICPSFWQMLRNSLFIYKLQKNSKNKQSIMPEIPDFEDNTEKGEK